MILFDDVEDPWSISDLIILSDMGVQVLSVSGVDLTEKLQEVIGND